MTPRYETLRAAIARHDAAPFEELADDPVVRETDPRGFALLHHAVRGKDAPIVDRLLRAGADPDARNAYYERTALHYAALEATGPIVTMLVARGADVHAVDSDGMTPLMWAPTNPGKPGIVSAVCRALLEGGARATDKTPEGRTALHGAGYEGSTEAAAELLAAGADPDARSGDAGLTPLHVCAANGGGKESQAQWVAVVEQLLAAGADRSAKTSGPGTLSSRPFRAGATPLDLAKSHRHDMIAVLLGGAEATQAPARKRR